MKNKIIRFLDRMYSNEWFQLVQSIVVLYLIFLCFVLKINESNTNKICETRIKYYEERNEWLESRHNDIVGKNFQLVSQNARLEFQIKMLTSTSYTDNSK